MIKTYILLTLLCCITKAYNNTTDQDPIEVTVYKKPFEDPLMHSVGSVLMFILIALSNAGGLSGAGSNIPIMLIFFKMNMKEAVPISGFVAVIASMTRFVVGYKTKHPHSEKRVSINYEVV